VSARILVGTAGWSYADWRGRVYPEPRPKGFDELRFLAGYLDCLEVNSTFYRVPTRRTVEEWLRRTAHLRDFVFTAKVHQSFTHGEGSPGSRRAALGQPDPGAAAGPAEARAFLEALAPLRAEGRLAALLLQFPWSFRDGPESRRRLARLCERFSGERLVVEVRHASFGTPEAEAFLAALGVGVADVDMPASKTNLPARGRALGPAGYVRLHGRNAAAWFDRTAGRDRRYDYLYSPDEVDDVVRRVRAMAAAVPLLFVITNNHFRGQGPANSFMLKARFAGRPVPVPPDLLRAFPGLAADAAPAPPGAQGTLFG
jgi:uncharacterized protein YecE (DUF72 family)